MATAVLALVAVVAAAAALALYRRQRRGSARGLLELRRADSRAAEHRRERDSAVARADALFRAAPGLFVVTDSRRSVQALSPGAATMFATSEGDALGASLITACRDHQLNELAGGCLATGDEQEATVYYRPAQRTVRARAVPLEDGVLLAMQDVTELERLERVRQEFVANLSHELRTPLASIRAMAETLAGGAAEDREVAQDFAGRIGVEVERLAQLVNELRLLSNVESGLTPLQRTAVSLASVTRTVIARLEPQADRGGLELGSSLTDELPPVLADPSRVEQVLLNLVHNAIKFTPPGGEVRVSARASDAKVEVAVRDSGSGIPAEELPRVFERFYKASSGRSTGGSGLGLALVKHVVMSHGGEVWGESREGAGSTFFFTLPLARR